MSNVTVRDLRKALESAPDEAVVAVEFAADQSVHYFVERADWSAADRKTRTPSFFTLYLEE